MNSVALKSKKNKRYLPHEVTTKDGYRYSYNRHVHHSNFGIWETDETQNGWGVMDYDCGTVPSPILESINGKPITDLRYAFAQEDITTAPTTPSTVTNMGHAFYRCTSLTGSITINTNHINNTNIGKDGSCYSCFSGVDFVAQNITLTGSASKDVLNLICGTGINWTPIS